MSEVAFEEINAADLRKIREQEAQNKENIL